MAAPLRITRPAVSAVRPANAAFPSSTKGIAPKGVALPSLTKGAALPPDFGKLGRVRTAGAPRGEAMGDADYSGSGEPASTEPRAPAAAAAIPSPMQGYMERLVKLIPCEVVGLYLVGNGIIPPGTKIATVIWSIVCLLLVVLVRSKATGDKANNISPQWFAVGISSVSFVIWVYNMPGPFQAYGLAIPFAGSLAVLVWTFVVPYFYRGS